MMRYIGKQNRYCSLARCERYAEFISDTKRVYCRMHAQFLLVGGQLLKDENDLREKLAEHTEAEMVEEQLDFDSWYERHYGPDKVQKPAKDEDI